MKPRSNEQGFIGLATLQLFILVVMLMIMAQMNRTLSMAREVQIDLLDQQADWLAESAAQQAFAALAGGTLSSASQTAEWTADVAPAYIGPDPLRNEEEREAGTVRVITAKYGYTMTATAAEVVQAVRAEAAEAYLVSAFAEIPFRGQRMRREVRRLGYRTPDGQWRLAAIVE